MNDLETIARLAPGVFYCLDQDFRFEFMNNKTLEMAGVQNEDTLLGRQYGDMKCDASQMHEAFCREDAKALTTGKEVKSVGIALYAGGHSIMLGSKVPKRNKTGQITGVISHYQDVTNLKILNLSALLSDENCADLKKSGQISLEITGYSHDDLKLSKRENEVLFYMLRGGTASQIASRLFISKRTVERHFENIKLKMACQSKPDVIEKAIDLGFMSQLPPHLVWESS